MAPKAQRKVPVPEGLDLDAWINEPPPEPSDEDEHSDSDESGKALPSKVWSIMLVFLKIDLLATGKSSQGLVSVANYCFTKRSGQW